MIYKIYFHYIIIKSIFIKGSDTDEKSKRIVIKISRLQKLNYYSFNKKNVKYLILNSIKILGDIEL